ncbi:MAG: hypothetical protein ACR2FY_05740 [Pirellulaceae bacterium]
MPDRSSTVKAAKIFFHLALRAQSGLATIRIMPKRSSTRQKDTQQLARGVLDAISPDAEPAAPAKNPAAVALGRLGGLKGGKARARSLSASDRARIAKKAAMARWNSKKK